jgi:NOL1/NOP2/sun family putative RNA methylase
MERLPFAFIKKMETLLGKDFDTFMASYDLPRSFGLRVNTLKLRVEAFQAMSPFSLEPIPWAESGFYYREEERPGHHPYHAAGLYYIQEPSAMAVAGVLGVKPGERVLDLCGAPGGKATQAAAALQGRGILLANEPVPSRAQILSQNVERLGIQNAVVTCESPQRLAQRFPGYFDKVLVDAPCSGEGMFRKDPQVCTEWRENTPVQCSHRQRDILEAAAHMVKVGGRMVYSTCTFSPEENERVISTFLRTHPEFQLVQIPLHEGFAPGNPQWGDGELMLERTVRLWPHRIRGEGHFIALLERREGPKEVGRAPRRLSVPRVYREFDEFSRQNLKEFQGGHLRLFGNELYGCPEEMPDIDGLRVLRSGWHLGTIKKKRFEPSHALALGLKKEEAVNTVPLSPHSPEIMAYLRGETLPMEGTKGWNLVLVDGYPIGWGKVADGLLKNHYPKGLRWF